MNIESIRHFIQIEILNDPEFAIKPDQDLLLSGTLDSVSVVRLVTHIEEQAQIEIAPEDVTLENFGTLETIVAYIEACQT